MQAACLRGSAAPPLQGPGEPTSWACGTSFSAKRVLIAAPGGRGAGAAGDCGTWWRPAYKGSQPPGLVPKGTRSPQGQPHHTGDKDRRPEKEHNPFCGPEQMPLWRPVHFKPSLKACVFQAAPSPGTERGVTCKPCSWCGDALPPGRPPCLGTCSSPVSGTAQRGGAPPGPQASKSLLVKPV